MFKRKTIEEQRASQRRASGQSGAANFYNNPNVRSIFYQIGLVAALLYFFGNIIGNTLANMEATGIKTGFDFLGASAGYDVLMSLISFESTDTYLRIFVVGFLNTLLVSGIGIFFATVLGFVFGVMHFSKNWLVKKLAQVYVEIFRNVPLLLQVFFWYFAVLSSLPGARQSLSLGEAIFLNVRGLYLPKLVGGDLSNWVWMALGAAIVGIFVLRRWAKKRQDETGQQFPVFYVSLGMVVLMPLVVAALTGFPFTVEYPALRGFNYFGGITIIPELMALAIALSVYTGAFIAEAVRAGVQAVPHGQTEAARSIGLREDKIMKLIIVPQAMRVIVPLLNSEYQSLVKNSTLRRPLDIRICSTCLSARH